MYFSRLRSLLLLQKYKYSFNFTIGRKQDDRIIKLFIISKLYFRNKRGFFSSIQPLFIKDILNESCFKQRKSTDDNSRQS